MIVTFTVSKRAHSRALRDVTRRTRSYKISVILFVLLPATILLYGLVRWDNMGSYLLGYLPYLLLGPLLVFVGFPLTYYLNVSRMHKNNAVLQKPQTFELTADHLVMRGPLHNSDLSWDAVHRVVETGDTFLFFISKYAAHFIPKDLLSVDEIRALRESLAQWLPGRVDLRSDAPSAQHAAA